MAKDKLSKIEKSVRKAEKAKGKAQGTGDRVGGASYSARGNETVNIVGGRTIRGDWHKTSGGGTVNVSD